MIVYVAGPMSGYEQFNRPGFSFRSKEANGQGICCA